MRRKISFPYMCIFSLLIFFAVLSVVIKSWVLSFISISFFMFYLAMQLKATPAVIVPLLGFIFIRLTELVSGVLIEQGGYLTETDVYGSSTGAFARLTAYYFLFFMSVVYGYSLACKYFGWPVWRQNPARLHSYWSISFVVLVLTFGLFAGLNAGFSFLIGVNRFSFREMAGTSALEFFLNNRFLSLALLGSFYASAKYKKSKIALMSSAIAVILLSVLHGEQFTAMVSLFLAFFIGPLLKLSLAGHDISSYVRKVGGCALVLGGVTVLLVYSGQGYNLSDTAERRLLLQGQLWFVTDQSIHSLWGGGVNSFIRNIESFFHLNVDGFVTQRIPFGMRELMYFYSDPAVYDVYMANNVTFTMGQMAMLLYWFGYLGMVIPVLLTGVLFGFIVSYFNSAVARHDFFSLILSSKLFVWFVFGFQQGEYWYILGLKTLLFCVAVFVFERVRNGLGVKFLVRPDRVKV